MILDLPLVAIGGTLCNERIWGPTLQTLDREAIMLTAGRLPSGAGTTPGDMATYAAALLKDLPPRFALAGFSLGGLIALELIAQAPDRIAGLALICAAAGPETPESANKRRKDEERAADIGMYTHAGEDIWPRFAAGDDTHRSTFCEMAESAGQALYQLQNDLAISRCDSLPRLSKIEVPVLLVAGGNDPLCPPSRHSAIAEMIGDPRRTVIDGTGHMLPLQEPRALAEYLGDWLMQIDPIVNETVT